MEFHMIEKFKCLLKDGRWPVSSQGIVISLDDSEDSFDSAAEEDDEQYLNGIFCSHSLKTSFHRHECSHEQLKQILMKEIHEHEKYAQLSAKNAAELLHEEEQEKLREERRKERKRRKKERKKAEKEAKGCNSNGNGAHQNSLFHNSNEGIKNNEKPKIDKNSAPEAEKSDEEENEGFLDVNSAFVTKVVKHKLRNNVSNTGHLKGNSSINSSKGNDARPMKQSSTGTRILQIPEKNKLLGERLAVAGYECASKENYIDAIELFTRALRNVPNDHRYWGNRSFCYFRIGAFQKALEDADCTIQLAPNSPKGHYRRAEALAGLKNLVDAEKSFEKVLELDVDCKDACDELLNVRMLRISEMGFDKKQAYCALKKYITLEAAVEALMNNENFDVESDEDMNLVYQSDEDINWDNVMEEYIENHENSSYSHNPPEAQNSEYYQSSFVQEPFQAQDIENYYDSDANKLSKKEAAMDPSNPNRCVSIWVGNIEECVVEKTISDEFSRFGEILSIKMLPTRHCAFINFKDSKAPGPAMAAMQGKLLAGKKLIIRYPNKTKEEQHIHQQMLCHQKRWQLPLAEDEVVSAGASGGFSFADLSSTPSTKTTLVPTPKGTRTKVKGPVNGDECYYWRTTGCAFGDNCRNKHVKENRGVDRKPWHK